MSRPAWKSAPPFTGSRRGPTVDESQPCAGQIDGVAAASALRRSTLRRTTWRRDSRPSSSARSRPNVSSGPVIAASVLRAVLSHLGAAAHRPRLDERRQLVHRPRPGSGRARTGPPGRQSRTAAIRSGRPALRWPRGSWRSRPRAPAGWRRARRRRSCPFHAAPRPIRIGVTSTTQAVIATGRTEIVARRTTPEVRSATTIV